MTECQIAYQGLECRPAILRPSEHFRRSRGPLAATALSPAPARLIRTQALEWRIATSTSDQETARSTPGTRNCLFMLSGRQAQGARMTHALLACMIIASL